MCKKECPCNPGGFERLRLWPEEQENEMKNDNIYDFTGDINNYYQCYKRLVSKGTIMKSDRISQRYLNIIKDFEYILKGGNRRLKDLIQGPPNQNCISSLKEELDEADGFLGYCFSLCAMFILLQLSSLCGICKSKDRCF